MRRKRQTLRTSLVWVAAESATALASAMCTALVVGRIIGPTQFGIAAVAYLLGSLGEVVVTTTFIDPLIQRRGVSPSLLNAAFTAVIGTAILTYIVLLISAPLLAHLYNEPALVPLISVQGTTCLFLGLRGVPEAILTRKLRFSRIALRGIVAKLLAAFVSIFAATTGLGAWSIVLGNVTFAASSTILIFAISRKLPRIVFQPRQMASLLSFGFFSLLDALLWTATPRLFGFLVGYYQGVNALGQLNVAFRIVDSLCYLMGAAITRIAFPLFSRISDKQRLEHEFLKGTQLVWVISTPVFLILAFLSQDLINLTMGAQWSVTAAALAAACLFSLLNFSRLLSHSTVKAMAKPELLIVPDVIGLIYIAVGCFVFRDAGFNAILGVWIGFGFVFVLCSLYMIKQALGTDWLTQMQPLGSATLPAVGMACVMYGIFSLHIPALPLAKLALIPAIGGLVYLGLLAMFDRPLIWQILGRRPVLES